MPYSFTITPTDVTNVAPEFSGITQERIDIFVGIVESFVCENVFGASAKNAVLFYLLHLLTMSARSGTAGNITAERVGELSRSYGSNPSGENSELAQTSYGMIYLNIRKANVMTATIVG